MVVVARGRAGGGAGVLVISDEVVSRVQYVRFVVFFFADETRIRREPQ